MPDQLAVADLETKSLAQLHELASQLDVPAFRSLRRQELIDAIVVAAAEQGGAGEDAERGDRSPATQRLEIDELEELEEREPEAITGGPPSHPPLGAPLHAPEWEHEHSAADADEPRADERLEDEPRDRGRAPAADDESTERQERQEAGVLDIVPDGFGFLRVAGLSRSREDVYVPRAVVRELGLRKGDEVAGAVRRGRRERHPSLVSVQSVNGGAVDGGADDRPSFGALTAIQPAGRLTLRSEPDELVPRMVDLLAPIGRGQRCLVAAPPGTGATTLLRELARVILREDGVVPVIVLVDARPEEVTDWMRAVDAPVHASASDRSSDAHVQLADLALERAKRLVESGQDVVLVIDSISRLARAHELARPRSRRDSADDAEFLAGEAVGVQAAKRWFSAARNTEEGGSLTIVAAARVGAGQTVGALYGALLDIANLELRLEPELAQSGLYPALDSRRSYNRREAELLDESQLGSLQRLRSSLIPLRAADAWTELAERLRSTRSNDELLSSI